MTHSIEIAGTEVTVKADTLADARLAIKELKLKKKEYSLRKRAIADAQRNLRAQYTEDVRARGSMMRGGGFFGKVARAFQSSSRDSRRARLAAELAPYETKKQEIEAVIRALDSAILQVEAAILQHSG